MKKAYSTPEIEKINFQYRDQVVVASSKEPGQYGHTGYGTCEYEKPVNEAGTNCFQ